MRRFVVPVVWTAFLAFTVAGCSMLSARIKPGDEARDFTLKTIDGETFQLAAFKGRKAVLLGIGNPYG